ncbi:MAG: 4-(cytidine 5'-diphospho)-2-C-methyl-D-erythritol kinase [Parachlamydia sp.]|nr:MAG: 4-(cytidine 5'-diphospho)-2-C-methyl-D-erythritol kinase [Parachlamydia sp.]
MLSFYSPAKINLFLQILARRADGYHQLATLMQTIGLADRLHIELATHDELTCTDADIPTDETNLVRKASALFRQVSGLNVHCKVHLEKQIPHQAGLGGGSSNAATTLWALNQLTGKPFTTQQLLETSAQIGSDIPFFFSQGTAYCSGRGEIVEAVPYASVDAVTIVKPMEGLATATIYQSLNLDNVCKQSSQEVLKSFSSQNPLYFNDLEPPAFSRMPMLSTLKKTLTERGFRTVLMSGSGSAFFCLGEGNLEYLPANLYSCVTSFMRRPSDSWYTP